MRKLDWMDEFADTEGHFKVDVFCWSCIAFYFSEVKRNPWTYGLFLSLNFILTNDEERWWIFLITTVGLPVVQLLAVSWWYESIMLTFTRTRPNRQKWWTMRWNSLMISPSVTWSQLPQQHFREQEETYSQTSRSLRCLLRGSNKTSAGQHSQPPELQILPVVCNTTKAQIHSDISRHSDKFWIVTLRST